ncbi:hypothetical protein M9H77_28208 [Catharanthus roseus]|uniref:Uncharacterized protein n=1 Tax=Catharanthus roseus TaxID=4058 RepID=A0ACC0AGC6_CATRO|nr:hypothetical protein M9H77_28208 [Catharanthus roseus]
MDSIVLGKVVMPDESLPQGIEGEVISIYIIKSIFDEMQNTYMRYHCLWHRSSYKNVKCPTFECVWEGVLIDQKEESTSTDMPLGTAIHNREITLGKGGQLARAAGVVVKLIAKEGK